VCRGLTVRRLMAQTANRRGQEVMLPDWWANQIVHVLPTVFIFEMPHDGSRVSAECELYGERTYTRRAYVEHASVMRSLSALASRQRSIVRSSLVLSSNEMMSCELLQIRSGKKNVKKKHNFFHRLLGSKLARLLVRDELLLDVHSAKRAHGDLFLAKKRHLREQSCLVRLNRKRCARVSTCKVEHTLEVSAECAVGRSSSWLERWVMGEQALVTSVVWVAAWQKWVAVTVAASWRRDEQSPKQSHRSLDHHTLLQFATPM
jgi:hypothetical protein